MSEEKKMKRNLLKNMLFSFIVFAILLLIFDFIIYNQISISLYKDIDKELYMQKAKYDGEEQSRKTTNKAEKNKNSGKKDYYNIKNLNPRIILVLRNENGEITNKEALGKIYEKYSDTIPFNSQNLTQIYNLKLDDKYNYRALNFETKNDDGKIMYIQLLANVDGEEKTLNNLLQMLIIGTIILDTISILASYILSKKMMMPIYNAYKRQTEFVENASHELRTPLTIIQAKQELLLQEPESKIIDKSEDINLTLKETRRLSKMIKELMALARSDSNEYVLNKEEINIDELIQEIVKPYIDYAKVENKTIKLELSYKKEIKVDKNKITELLIILLDNAIKYTGENDTITIKTYSKDGKCNIEVADTGIGISDEGLKRIFERFYREDKARTREKGGTGLGLSIAHTIVIRHKGSIKAMHNKPKGTVFLVRI